MNGCLRAALALAASVLAVNDAPAQKAPERRTAPAAAPQPAAQPPLVTAISLADAGFANGFRLANLAGRREIFIPVPQGSDIRASELALTYDDISAHPARRSLEILVNDRSVAAIALDGRSAGRALRIPLSKIKARDGFFRLTFNYSGAATQDRCIDVRYVGDSLTIHPESSLEIEIPSSPGLDLPASAALLPREVSIVTSGQPMSEAGMAAALSVARALKSRGHAVSFHHGFERLPELARRQDPHRWTRGLVLLGKIEDAMGYLDAPIAKLAGATPALGTLAAVRTGGLPALLVSDGEAAQAARLLGSPALAAARGASTALVGEVSKPAPPSDRMTFDELKLAPEIAEVYGRAELSFAIAGRALPAGTRPSRLTLDILVAPDGAGERAVVSAFVNDRLLDSMPAAINEPTRLDVSLPDGLVGADTNVRVVVQRRSAQGDCRFEPQGYPAQILGSSAVVLSKAAERTRDFSDLSAWFADRIEVVLPATAATRPQTPLALVAGILSGLSSNAAPISVRFQASDSEVHPSAAFIAVSTMPPPGSDPRVRFDRGTVAVADRSGKRLLDLGGTAGSAVVQTVRAGGHPGLWIKPTSDDGSLPAPSELRLDRGDVAFVDKTGVALALSTERDTLVRIAYPDQVSWLTIAERFRTWIVAAVWALASIAFLYGLQRIFRRQPTQSD